MFYEEKIATFKLKKFQIGTKIDKKTQSFKTFKVFYAIFVKFDRLL